MQQLTFWSEERPVNPSASQAFEKGLLTIAGTLPLNLYAWLKNLAPDGWFGKMCLACCPLTEDGRLAPSSEGWQNAGMGSPTGFLTLSISECHSGAGVCSLSDTRLNKLDLMANRWKGGFAVILTLGAIAGFVIDQIMHLFSPR